MSIYATFQTIMLKYNKLAKTHYKTDYNALYYQQNKIQNTHKSTQLTLSQDINTSSYLNSVYKKVMYFLLYQ